jgi:hypothetical protein
MVTEWGPPVSLVCPLAREIYGKSMENLWNIYGKSMRYMGKWFLNHEITPMNTSSLYLP